MKLVETSLANGVRSVCVEQHRFPGRKLRSTWASREIDGTRHGAWVRLDNGEHATNVAEAVLDSFAHAEGLRERIASTAEEIEQRIISAKLPQNCPVCGKRGRVYDNIYSTPRKYHGWCSDTDCLRGPDRCTAEEAIVAWNRIRVISPAFAEVKP